MAGGGFGRDVGVPHGMAGGRHATAATSGFARGAAARDPARQQPPALLFARAGQPVLAEPVGGGGSASRLLDTCLRADDQSRPSADDAAVLRSRRLLNHALACGVAKGGFRLEVDSDSRLNAPVSFERRASIQLLHRASA